MFKERDIKNSFELARCILICRFIRTSKLIVLIGVVLYGFQSYSLLTSNLAILLVIATGIALFSIDAISHYLLLKKDKKMGEFDFPHVLKASIWQLYKCDAKGVSDESVTKFFKER